MRIIALVGLLGCSPTSERWARSHLGRDGAHVLEKEALDWLTQHPDPPIATELHCSSPRVLFEVSDYLPHELKYSPLNHDDSIQRVADVRCLVLYTHHGQEMAHHPETRLSVRVIDRATGTGPLLEVRDHKGVLEGILAKL